LNSSLKTQSQPCFPRPPLAQLLSQAPRFPPLSLLRVPKKRYPSQRAPPPLSHRCFSRTTVSAANPFQFNHIPRQMPATSRRKLLISHFNEPFKDSRFQQTHLIVELLCGTSSSNSISEDSLPPT
ncbi:hypothetical protein POUND7_013659, partial [Theobroma cacao]